MLNSKIGFSDLMELLLFLKREKREEEKGDVRKMDEILGKKNDEMKREGVNL